MSSVCIIGVDMPGAVPLRRDILSSVPLRQLPAAQAASPSAEGQQALMARLDAMDARLTRMERAIADLHSLILATMNK